MLGGNIDVSFPKNLRDPMNADPAPVGFRISSLHSHQALRVWHFVLVLVSKAVVSSKTLAKPRGQRLRRFGQ
jgi:hypothetical protein